MRAFESPWGHFQISVRRQTIKTSELIEIRWHGRGGQGAVTSAELIAQAAIAEGKYAQAFPSFGPERRGAPVMSFNRIDVGSPIRNRAGVTTPDIVVVLDPSLLNIGNVTSGLKTGGAIILNTSKNANQFKDLTDKFVVATVDATRIAREVLGMAIVNTTMLGAIVRTASFIRLGSLDEPLKARFGKLAEKNLAAMKRAYDETSIKELSTVG